MRLATSGTTFAVYLPRSSDASAELERARGHGQCVMVVHEEAPLVELAARSLEELGYVAVRFTSPQTFAVFRADLRL